MKFSERMSQSYERVEKPVKELLAKLSVSQRWSLAILGGVVLLLLGMVVAYGPDDDLVYHMPIDADRLIIADLQENDIPFDEKDGQVVLAAKDRHRVNALFIKNAHHSDDPELFKWLYQQTSWNESSGQRRDKMLDTKKKEVRAAIQELPGIAKAVVTVNMNHNSRFVLGESPSTASVMLTPENERVSRKIANGIRKFVAFSFGLKLHQVSLMDHHGSISSEDSIEAIADTKVAIEELIKRKLLPLLGALFSQHEFRVEVDVLLDSQSKRQSSVTYDPDGLVSAVERERRENDNSEASHQAPGTKPNTAALVETNSGVSTTTTREYEETDYENYASVTNEEVSAPAGELERVNIVVYVSRTALAQQINLIKGASEDEKPSEDEILQKIKEIEQDVRALPAIEPEKINAHVRPWVMPASVFPVSAEDTVGILGFAQSYGRELVLAFLAVVGCFLLYRAASRSTPELEALPDPVADLEHFLREKEERDRARALELAREQEDQSRRVDWEAKEEDRDAIDLLESVSQFAEERPDLAASVLRSWLHEVSKKENLTPEKES